MMFDEREKQAFRYFDGARERYGDPLAIEMRMARLFLAADQSLSTKLDSKAEMAQIEGTIETIPIILGAFEMKPFDPETGEGATSQVALDTLAAFNLFRKNLKKKPGNSPNGSQPTDGLPGESSDMSTISASGTTASGARRSRRSRSPKG